MNRRKAKKMVKKKWNIKRWKGNIPPKTVNSIFEVLGKGGHFEFRDGILYGVIE